MRILLKNMLADDPIKTVAFVRHRNFGITEIELQEVLRILCDQKGLQKARLEESREFLKSFPEIYPIINRSISQMTFSSAEKVVYELFPEISAFLAYTTDTPAVENILRQVKNSLGIFLDDRNPQKVAGFLDFFEDLMKHIEALELIESSKKEHKDKKKIKWTEGYEFAEFMLNLYQKIPLLSLQEALRLLDIYYERIIMPVFSRVKAELQSKKTSHSSSRLDQEYAPEDDGETVDQENMQEIFSEIKSSLPLLEHLDFVFVEYLSKMNHYEACHVLFIFSESGYNNSLFLKNFSRVYSGILLEDTLVEQGIIKPKNLFKLLRALTRAKSFPGEKLLWRLLEL